jgi:flavin reductase (DIM6/NTAB) family NADH-FMN oxidoreductase RutF
MKKSLGPMTLGYPLPVWLIGTYDATGKPNIMTASWVGICCSRPPCVAVSLQKPRYSFNGIVGHNAFTVSIPSEANVRETDFAGIASGRNIEKFATVGLTPVRSSLVDAPYVQEFPVILECRLLHTLDLGSHTQFIGEIIDAKAEEDVLGENGLPDILKVKPVAYETGQKSYYGIGTFLGKAYTLGKVFENPDK